MRLPPTEALRRARETDHGVLATVHPARGADAIPACFAIDRGVVAIPIDRVKPKASTELQRVRNLTADPRASLLCERWDPLDWSELWWVRLEMGRSDETAARIRRLDDLLRRKYPNYRTEPFESILTFRIRGVTGWSAS